MANHEHRTWDGTVYTVTDEFETELYDAMTKPITATSTTTSPWTTIKPEPIGPKWYVKSKENDE